MAKEIIPPDPIPIGEETIINDDSYCASFMNYSDKSYSDQSKELLNYLESEYDNSGLGDSTRSFIAHDTTVPDILESILDKNISGIDKFTIDKYVMLSQYDNDVMIFVILY